jgi:hypothetical protein
MTNCQSNHPNCYAFRNGLVFQKAQAKSEVIFARSLSRLRPIASAEEDHLENAA